MKRIITVLLLVSVLCFSLASCGSSDLDFLSGNTDITYEISDGEATVTAVPNKSIVTEIVIPDEYEGAPVTEIAKFACVNLEYVTKVSIGKNVKEISDWAFGNSKKIAAFEVDEENPYICDVDGVIYTKDMEAILFYPPAGGVRVEKDENGNVTVVHFTYDLASRGGNSPDGRKVKGTIHWVPVKEAVKVEARLYENIIDEEKGVYNEDGSLNLNPNSIEVLKECYIEPVVKGSEAYDSFQFVRTGFFCVDSKDSTPENLVFNRIVSLKSSFNLPKKN